MPTEPGIDGAIVVSANGSTESFSTTRNALGQKISSKDPIGNVTTYTYFPFGNLASVTGAAGKAADPDDLIILLVARAPTPVEITNLRNALGQTTSTIDVFGRIKIVSKQTDLYNILNTGLH